MPGFGQNGSVAWVVVGNKGNGHVHARHKDGERGKIEDPPIEEFWVRLRFADAAAANAAWEHRVEDKAYGEFVVILKVPAQPVNTARTQLNLDGDDEPIVNPPWEIGIDWDQTTLQALGVGRPKRSTV
jgi:hypothetical protein